MKCPQNLMQYHYDDPNFCWNILAILCACSVDGLGRDFTDTTFDLAEALVIVVGTPDSRVIISCFAADFSLTVSSA